MKVNTDINMSYYEEPTRRLPIREFEVVVVGGGTAGVVAAVAAARLGAKTALVELKGYVGGIAVEGGTALHSFFNLWKAFPGVEKRQVVKGIPQEIIDRLAEVGGTSGHAETMIGFDYDSICTAIDTELYKLVAFEMLLEAGVSVFVNTLAVAAVVADASTVIDDTVAAVDSAVATDDATVSFAARASGKVVRGVVVESRSGREFFAAKQFIDATGYGDLAAFAGAKFSEPNDYAVANSIGVGGVSLEKYHEFLREHDAVSQYSVGRRSDTQDSIVRLDANTRRLPREFVDATDAIGMSLVTTSVHDDYFMFVKLNYKMPVSPTNRDASVIAEVELRRRQAVAVDLLRRHIPGCEKAFITRTSPSLCIRRGRCILCDYDMPLSDILAGRHFEDDVMAYGFHDCAPRLQVRDGGTYGLPYRMLRVVGLENLLAVGMMITSDWEAHMSTRNTVCCMGQGQAAGTAAALCAQKDIGTRELPYDVLHTALVGSGVHLEN